MMRWPQSISFYVFAAIWTGLLGILGVPLLLIKAPKATIRLSRLWAGGMIYGLRLFCGVKWQVKGKRHIPKQPAIIASEHQSAWETLAYAMLLPKAVFVMKQELLNMPIIGAYLKACGHIAIDRRQGRASMQTMLEGAERAISEGRHIIVFPQGTRVKPGHTARLKTGWWTIVKALEVPVIPVTLNSGEHWPKDSLRKTPGIIEVQFHPKIQGDKQKVLGELKALYDN